MIAHQKSKTHRPSIQSSIVDLSNEVAHQFLAAFPGTVASTEFVHPESFRGGFRIRLIGSSDPMLIEYLEMQLEVTTGGRELFGPTVHAGFEGNMFSNEHLRQHLPRIVVSVSGQLRA